MSWISSALGMDNSNDNDRFGNLNRLVGFAANPIGNTLGKWADPLGSAREGVVKNIGGNVNGDYGKYQADLNNPLAGLSTGSGSRDADIAAGRARGAEIFDSPDMLRMQARKDDLSKGYSGQELGALKGQAQREIGGQRAGYTQQLLGNLARSGVGGARAAAMRGAADVGYNKNLTDFERKLTADNAGLIRQGEQEATDFALKRKYGGLGTEMGYAQLGVNERTANNAAAQANKKEGFNLFNPGTWFGG